MSRRARIVLCGALVAGCQIVAPACRRTAVAPPPVPRRDIPLAAETRTVDGRVPRAATLDALLRQLGVRTDLVPSIVSQTRTVFDPRKLRSGNPYRFVTALDGTLRSFEYEIDFTRFLRIERRHGGSPADLTAAVVPYEMERGIVALRGGISKAAPSLFDAMAEAGEQPDLSVSLADVFSADIDFNSDLQPGDGFGVAFEKIYREGGFVAYGGVIAA